MEQVPAPIIVTPMENEKILETKTFNIESNKKNLFEIKISKSINQIILEGKSENSVDSDIFSSKVSIEQIKINKYFLMFDNMTEIYDEIINLIKNNKPILIEDNNKLLISIPLSTTKIKEIILEMFKKEKSDKEKVEDLYLIIKDLKSFCNKKINELNNKIEKQNIIIENQNNKINELNNKIENQNEQIKELQKKLEEKNNSNLNNINTFNIFRDSLIINQNLMYISYLKKWISPNDQPFTTKLLFRRSNNGDSYEEFHRLCDNQGITLVLIKGEEGFIIGGYTTKNWDKSGYWYKDDNSFLFSLTNGQIFPIRKNMDSIRGSKELGPWFAYIGFRDRGKENLSQGHFYYKDEKGRSFENYDKIIPNGKEDRAFDVTEVEIYKIGK